MCVPSDAIGNRVPRFAAIPRAHPRSRSERLFPEYGINEELLYIQSCDSQNYSRVTPSTLIPNAILTFFRTLLAGYQDILIRYKNKFFSYLDALFSYWNTLFSYWNTLFSYCDVLVSHLITLNSYWNALHSCGLTL